MKTCGFTTRLGLLLLALVAAIGMLVWADEPPKGLLPGGEKGGAPPLAVAQSDTHGGVIANTKEFNFEVAFHTDRVALYLYDQGMVRLPLKGVKGTVDLEFIVRAGEKVPEKGPGLKPEIPEKGPGPVPEKGGEKAIEKGRAPLAAPLVFIDTKEGDSLEANLDLSRIAEGDAQATFKLTGLSGKEERDATINVPFRVARLARYACSKDNVEQDRPGKCPKCLSDLHRQWIFYGCPVHAEVASDRKTDTCWKCGGKMLLLMVEGEKPIQKGQEEKRPE